MNQFNIFLDFYRIIAEMTEEEIVSAIGSPKYRNTVESVRRIFLEQGEKAANEEKKKLPSVTFSANYRGGRSNATLVKYLGYIVIDIDHLSKEELARILQTVRACSYTRIAFISPKGMGLKIIAHTQRPDGTLPDTIQPTIRSLLFTPNFARPRLTPPVRMWGVPVCCHTIRASISIVTPLPSSWNSPLCSIKRKRRRKHPEGKSRKRTTIRSVKRPRSTIIPHTLH